MYSTFNKTANNALLEPMFFGQEVNVARYDQQKYPIFEKLIEKQLSFFWRPEEVDVSRDSYDFVNKLNDAQRHIFLSNLKYQTLLDSVQGRSPVMAFLPFVSIPELETWIETWSFSETIHSRSYTHIIRNVASDQISEIFDDVINNADILKRAESVTQYYDDLINYGHRYQVFGEGKHLIDGEEVRISLFELKKKLYLAMMSVNILEAVRFYVSFACSFVFAEKEMMEGNAKIVKLIARDEALHLSGTQHIINILAKGDDDPEMAIVAAQCQEQAIQMFKEAADQEKDWAEYLFKDGSILGLNLKVLSQYVEYITNIRMEAVGLPPVFEKQDNPIPWINSWLNSDNVQVAPQEAEISSYLVGQVTSAVEEGSFTEFEL